MAIERIVETDVYCDICGEWIVGWKSDEIGVSRAWAAVCAREKGCTVGKKVICRNCRIKQRIQICSIQRRIGSAGETKNGMCLGFELEKCKRCFACTSFATKEENNRDKENGNPVKYHSIADQNVNYPDCKNIYTDYEESL